MVRERRKDGYYPTDPKASAALAWWLRQRAGEALRTGVWVDPAAGDGLLLSGLGVPVAQRRAIELHDKHALELKRRVPSAKIGNGLTLSWADARHVAMNPDFNNETMTAFVARALKHQEATRGLVCCLALATWWHSDAMRLKKAAGVSKPTHILVPAERVSCDGTGRGDMRAIDWLVWHPAYLGQPTVVEWLPPATPSADVLADHKRLALAGAAP